MYMGSNPRYGFVGRGVTKRRAGAAYKAAHARRRNERIAAGIDPVTGNVVKPKPSFKRPTESRPPRPKLVATSWTPLTIGGLTAKGESGPAPASKPKASNLVTSISSGLQSVVTALGPTLSLYNQQRLANENLRRSRQGLAPLDYQDIPGMVPTAEVRAGLDDATGKTVLIAAALIGGALLLGGMGKNQRGRA